MASVQIKNDRYYFVYYDPATSKHRWKSSGIAVDPKNSKKSELAANMALGEFMAKIEGRVVEEQPAPKRERKDTPSGVFFHDFLPVWLADKKKNIRADSYEGYEPAVRLHMTPYFKDHPILIQDINEDDLQAYLNAMLEKGLSVNTLTKHRAFLGSALYLAAKQGIISGRNYLKGVKLPSVPRYNGNFFTTEQIDTLLQYSRNNPYYPVFYLCAKLGLRRSEAIGIHWSAIDFNGKIIRINHTAIDTKENGLVLSDMTKNESSNRVLPLTPRVSAFLKELKRQQAEMRLFLGEKYNTKYEDYVCVHDDGRLLSPDGATFALKKMSRQLTATKGYPEIRLHDLRHSFATGLIKSGNNIKVVSKLLGHSTEATTLKIYYHVNNEDFAKALIEQDAKMAM